MILQNTTYARVGLMGNPSDGYFGKTLAFLIRSFSATVTVWESPSLSIIPHSAHDPTSFDSIDELTEVARRDGYYGGLRLLFATCKKFNEYCSTHGLRLPRRNFTITYETDIPRQVGLGGSSAIIAAAMKCLMDFCELTDADIPKPIQPSLVLSVELEELDIAAGLQDRVIQVYGGLVCMDFDREYMEEHGYGKYESLDVQLLPRLALAYVPEPKDSGKFHSDVRYRFEQGDTEVVEAMRTFAEYTDAARAALDAGDHERFGELMNENFDLRRRIYGDEAIGAKNLEMIELARSFGMPAKFSGSGGAIIMICEDDDVFSAAQEAFLERGFIFMHAEPTNRGCWGNGPQ
ncbi:MAG: hypothetical protein PVH68_05565 [Armatimonadota bacterium]|jgi:glucuronokinase